MSSGRNLLNRVEYNVGMNALPDNSIVSAAFFAGMEVSLGSAIACPDLYFYVN